MSRSNCSTTRGSREERNPTTTLSKLIPVAVDLEVGTECALDSPLVEFEEPTAGQIEAVIQTTLAVGRHVIAETGGTLSRLDD